MKLSTIKNFQEPMSIASLTRLWAKNALDVRFDTLLEADLKLVKNNSFKSKKC